MKPDSKEFKRVMIKSAMGGAFMEWFKAKVWSMEDMSEESLNRLAMETEACLTDQRIEVVE